MKKIYALGLSLVFLGCGTPDPIQPESLITPATSQEISSIADAEPAAVEASSIEQIIQGSPIQVAFDNSTAELSLVYDESSTATIAMESDDGITTYFQKQAVPTLGKIANLDLFLQGVWVAIAQMKNGIYFKLTVDTENRLELYIDQKESGVQIDIQVQGTPSAEQVSKAEKLFTQWVNQLSSSSSIFQTEPSSSSTTPSSSSVQLLPSSSSSIPSSSSQSLPLSSSTITSSSSSQVGEVCLFDEYKMLLIEMKSWFGEDVVYTKETCFKGTVLFKASNKTKYIDITLLGDSPYYNKIAIKGAPIIDTKTCSFTQSNTATNVWNVSDAFYSCLDSI